VQHANTLPALLAHGDILVNDVAGMAARLRVIVEYLEKQTIHV